MHHFDRAAGKPESHRPQGAGARPIDKVIDAGGDKAALRKTFFV
jgi:hypothetical protein